MEKGLNIAAILKDKPVGLKFYSPTFGCVTFNGVHKDKVYFFSKDTNAHSVKQNGKMFDGGECIIFPSESMRDWSRFAWKKGDVLIMDGYRVVFDKWLNDDYTRFNAVHLITSIGGYIDKPLQNRYSPISNFITRNLRKMTDAETKIYMDSLERECGGKLNRETLVVEKPHPEFKDGDIAFADYGNRQDVFIVSGKTGLSEGYNSFIALDLRGLTLSMGYRTSFFKKNLCELRPATDEERQRLFDALAKENKKWDAEKKAIVNLPKKSEFKIFQKVLVRNYNGEEWIPGFFFRIHNDGCRYILVCGEIYKQCIPYNDHTEHLLGTTDEWKGGEG